MASIAPGRQAIAARRIFVVIVMLASTIGSGSFVPVISAQSDVTLVPLATGFTQPLAVVDAPDNTDRLFVVERRGRIRIVEGGQILPTPYLDVSSLITSSGQEQGLLGLAFHPNYANNGVFFIYYTAAGDGANTLARYHVSPNPTLADSNSGAVLFAIPDHFSNHNGGHVVFGPDGYLYVGTGDGGSGGDPDDNGQSLNTLLGKILRIDPDAGSPYAIPPSNPFVNTPGARGEIWAYGLRNPWRFSFDRQSGDLYIADVGQNAFEEVNLQPAVSGGGQNYGWNLMEGMHCYDAPTCNQTGLTLPIAEYGRSDGCSITGGYVYRGPAAPSLVGAYVYGDFCSGKIWTLRQGAGGGWTPTLLMDTPHQISSFGESNTGEMYLVDLAGGVHRFVGSSSATATPTRTATSLPRTPTQAATSLPSTPTLSITAVPTVSGTIGGRQLTLDIGATARRLTWLPGTRQTSYLLAMLTPAGESSFPLAGDAQTIQAPYVGTPPAFECFRLNPLQGSTSLGFSDVLCDRRGFRVGLAPVTLSISLSGTSTASLSWPAVSGAEVLHVVPLGSDTYTTIPGTSVAATQSMTGATCFVVVPANGVQLLGVSDAVCGFPGLNTIGG